MAKWRSGYAAVCKTAHTGSIPVFASNLSRNARLDGEARRGLGGLSRQKAHGTNGLIAASCVEPTPRMNLHSWLEWIGIRLLSGIKTQVRILPSAPRFGPVVQWRERCGPSAEVAGSNPAGITNLNSPV